MTSTTDERRLAVLFHESEALGAGISILRAAKGLKDRGWSVAGWFPEEGPLVTTSSATLDLHGVAARPLAFSLQGWRRSPGVLSRARGTPSYLRAVRAWLRVVRPTVVHANSLLVLPEATVARRLGIPVVVQVHELRPATLKLRATLRWAASVADVFVGVSDAVSATLRAQTGRTPVRTVYNGVDPHPPSGHPREAVVGAIGYVSRTKGTDVFLHAARRVLSIRPDLRFEHVGQARLWGDDAFDREIDALASSSPLAARVSMRGRASVPEALARWEMFVLSSRSEAFPLSTLEAMAAGVPVIATNVGGVPEQITHLESGLLVPAGDAEALAASIVRLHDDPALRARLGEAGRERVRERFPLDAQVTGLELVYDEALRRRGVR